MSIHSVLTMPRQADQASAAAFSPRANARQGEDNSCWSTALKVVGVIAAIAASAAGFVFLGPIGGGIITVLAGGAALFLLFKNCCGTPAHDHAHEVAVPWYQRVFSFFPAGNAPDAGPHVRVGGGHIPPAAAARPWYDNWFSFMPGGVRHMDGGGRGGAAHVPAGRGHGPGAPVHGHGAPPPGGNPPGPGGAHIMPGGGHMRGAPVPGGPGAAPHMGVGRGHVHGPGGGPGRGGLPPPSGPGGPGAHVPVGRGH